MQSIRCSSLASSGTSRGSTAASFVCSSSSLASRITLWCSTADSTYSCPTVLLFNPGLRRSPCCSEAASKLLLRIFPTCLLLQPGLQWILLTFHRLNHQQTADKNRWSMANFGDPPKVWLGGGSCWVDSTLCTVPW